MIYFPLTRGNGLRNLRSVGGDVYHAVEIIEEPFAGIRLVGENSSYVFNVPMTGIGPLLTCLLRS